MTDRPRTPAELDKIGRNPEPEPAEHYHLNCTEAAGHAGDHQSSKGFEWWAEGDDLVRCWP